MKTSTRCQNTTLLPGLFQIAAQFDKPIKSLAAKPNLATCDSEVGVFKMVAMKSMNIKDMKYSIKPRTGRSVRLDVHDY